MIRELICEEWPIAPLKIHHVQKVHMINHWHHYHHKHHVSHHHICHHQHLRCHWELIDDEGSGGGSPGNTGIFIPLELPQYFTRSDSLIQQSGIGELPTSGIQSEGIQNIVHYNISKSTIINNLTIINNNFNTCCNCSPINIPESATVIMLFIGFAIIAGLNTLKGKFR